MRDDIADAVTSSDLAADAQAAIVAALAVAEQARHVETVLRFLAGTATDNLERILFNGLADRLQHGRPPAFLPTPEAAAAAQAVADPETARPRPRPGKHARRRV